MSGYGVNNTPPQSVLSGKVTRGRRRGRPGLGAAMARVTLKEVGGQQPPQHPLPAHACLLACLILLNNKFPLLGVKIP